MTGTLVLSSCMAASFGELPRTTDLGATQRAGVARCLEGGAGPVRGYEAMNWRSDSVEGAAERTLAERFELEAMPNVNDIFRTAVRILGDRARAENWFNKYGQMPEELKTALKAASDVPVDVDPVFEFAERVK